MAANAFDQCKCKYAPLGSCFGHVGVVRHDESDITDYKICECHLHMLLCIGSSRLNQDLQRLSVQCDVRGCARAEHFQNNLGRVPAAEFQVVVVRIPVYNEDKVLVTIPMCLCSVHRKLYTGDIVQTDN